MGVLEIDPSARRRPDPSTSQDRRNATTLDLTEPGTDPLAEQSALVFALSPLVGTPLTSSAEFALVAISPLTGRICDALSSSHFALAAKRAGVDAIVITGRRAEPSIVFVVPSGLAMEQPCWKRSRRF
ncbi:MAG TPA: aldehyde ferredoxin oxidoreductase N-terminal domain-containing protein [Isosphaeraceae bacterium]|nr:aldehyde ferredoxin oxidoreductase N-terminal domain-containing protein [Isosphaeraceae bacterium]